MEAGNERQLAEAPPVYWINGASFTSNAPGFDAALEEAVASRRRPRCMCVPAGVDMYVSRLDGRFTVKRMPESGSQHAPHCPSYGPPLDGSGLGRLLGSAIKRHPVTGVSTLRLAFALSNRRREPASSVRAQPVKVGGSQGRRLSMLALLHYLWEQAELNQWRPVFSGKRSWSTVRSRLLGAASEMWSSGEPLTTRLYIPEAFSVEDWDSIRARRWQLFSDLSACPSRLHLLLAELKEIAPSRAGHLAVFKHMPDVGFVVPSELQRRLVQTFENELSHWNFDPSIRMLVLTSFGLNRAKVPVLSELTMTTGQRQWLLVTDAENNAAVTRQIEQQQSFIVPLRYTRI